MVNANKLKYEQYNKRINNREDYKDRVESQDELFNLLEKCFQKTLKMDFNNFAEIVEKVSSDIFLYVIIII